MNKEEVRRGIADNPVLFVLDRRDDPLHLGTRMSLKSRQQHLIPNRFVRVKDRGNFAVFNVKLAL